MRNPIKNSISLFFRLMISAGLICIFTFTGCRQGVREDITKVIPLKKIRPSKYPVFSDRVAYASLIRSIENSLVYFKRVPLSRNYTYGDEFYTAAHMIVSLETLLEFVKNFPDEAALDGFIRKNYFVYAAAGNSEKQTQFTGYYEPTYPGSLEKSERFSHPLYSKPGDLLEIDLSLFSDKYKGHKRLVARVNETQKRVVPYFSREQINQTKEFGDKAPPVAWLQSRVDRFFLEIQGSGRIELEDGRVLRVHYAGSNGNAYRSVGRYLIEQNEIPKEKMSMQAIRKWLEENPERIDEVLHYNESFVFFGEEEGGPYGSLGVEITAMRSIATDSRLFPKGALCFLKTRLPKTVGEQPVEKWEETSFFALNQDTGGAIKGPARADIFCGNDAFAEFTAGHMNVFGKLYFLVLKPQQE